MPYQISPEEKKFRKNILILAKNMGRDIEVKAIMKRYDEALKKCTNDVEAKQMAIMGAAEIHRILDCYGALVVDNKEIIPAEPGGNQPKVDEKFAKITG